MSNSNLFNTNFFLQMENDTNTNVVKKEYKICLGVILVIIISSLISIDYYTKSYSRFPALYNRTECHVYSYCTKEIICNDNELGLKCYECKYKYNYTVDDVVFYKEENRIDTIKNISNLVNDDIIKIYYLKTDPTVMSMDVPVATSFMVILIFSWIMFVVAIIGGWYIVWKLMGLRDVIVNKFFKDVKDIGKQMDDNL